ncbi:ABC transporter ATP-binding protein [Actinokineospora xionganensis]|uniref:Sn-glycerol-3-phosphate ABC transporter ATP-binding protein UgpC n=1 Tax=Actinokineospora xionganensis TaxID=2684470 RepID=A0ABR7L016_9PSEU|nr:sn-glycerol-3-phosphate ABC transporter ATP-binding protein UgpC [Actinokineospora xionganensis]MBC6446030.1 sn-glycerol-3-phosphate ABC transporter ATP-binding protein UgpC [Actinokineospora xionganensis]
MATVEYRGATRHYAGTSSPAVDNLDLRIRDGECMVLVGPSGCGKSTALRMLAGLEAVDGGEIRIGGADVTHAEPKERDIAMVFQNYALYPHMTVRQNIAFHLRVAKMGTREIEHRVSEAARMLELEPYLDRRPDKLSGGQRQRVAMGRAIIRRPRVFCMDEPLSNLDAKLRVQTRTQIASLQRRLGVTTVYVTHDQVEAMTMGDRVAILKDGRLQQCDTPRTVFDRPRNLFVAGFIGSPAMNLIPLYAQDWSVEFGGTRIGLTPAQRAAASSREITIGVRPEGLRVVGAAQGRRVVIEMVEELGSDNYLYTSADGNSARPIVVRSGTREIPSRGTTIGLRLHRADIHLFDSLTGERLPD